MVEWSFIALGAKRMSNWKARLQDSVTLIACSAIFLILLVVGIYILSYLIIAIAAVGIIVFLTAQISSWFNGNNKSKIQHRVIDHEG
jgi:VIT1/CCC1 family predicted Fe2+/Mn2+ transporter